MSSLALFIEQGFQKFGGIVGKIWRGGEPACEIFNVFVTKLVISKM